MISLYKSRSPDSFENMEQLLSWACTSTQQQSLEWGEAARSVDTGSVSERSCHRCSLAEGGDPGSADILACICLYVHSFYKKSLLGSEAPDTVQDPREVTLQETRAHVINCPPSWMGNSLEAQNSSLSQVGFFARSTVDVFGPDNSLL